MLVAGAKVAEAMKHVLKKFQNDNDEVTREKHSRIIHKVDGLPKLGYKDSSNKMY